MHRRKKRKPRKKVVEVFVDGKRYVKVKATWLDCSHLVEAYRDPVSFEMRPTGQGTITIEYQQEVKHK